MRHILATPISFISGFLLYMVFGMVFGDMEAGAKADVPMVAWFGLFGGWLVTHWFCVKGTQRLLKVLSRGFLIGAFDWFLVILSGFVVGGKAVATSGANSGAEQAGAAIGGGLITMLTGGLGGLMMLVCLMGFAITYFMGKESKPDDGPTKDCPECAETIKAAAKKCRHCGHIFDEAAAQGAA